MRISVFSFVSLESISRYISMSQPFREFVPAERIYWGETSNGEQANSYLLTTELEENSLESK